MMIVAAVSLHKEAQSGSQTTERNGTKFESYCPERVVEGNEESLRQMFQISPNKVPVDVPSDQRNASFIH